MNSAKSTADKAQKRVIGRPFQPGNNANPAGRPKGSKNKLTEHFLRALADDFEVHGEQAIAMVREEKTDVYLKIIASLMPKELHLKTDPLEELSDDQLRARAEILVRALGLAGTQPGDGAIDVTPEAKSAG